VLVKTHSNRLWIVALALGWAFDFLFWKKAPGVNFAIYVLLCLIGGFFLLLQAGTRPARTSLWLLPPIGFLAAMSFMRQEPLTSFLAYATTLFLLALLAATYLGGRWFWYSLADYVVGFLRLLGSMLARPLGFANEVRRERPEAESRSKSSKVWPVVRGLLIALPVVAIFAALLSSADLIFAQRLDDFIALFNLEKLPEYIFRGVYILIGAYLLAGVFLHAAEKSRDEKLFGQDKPLLAPFLGFTETGIVLGSLLVLFAVFVVIQFQYFFGGQANINIEGFTYSEYARRGFGELVTVAFFSLLLLLGLSAITRRESHAQRRAFSGMGIGLVALVIVMLVSAFYRLVLYESAYGFSRLRTYTHVFIIWLGLLLVVVVALEILHRERVFALAAVLASLGFVLTLPLLNVDAFIVRQNVARAVQGQELDVSYLASLSDDAIPALAGAYQNASLAEKVHEELGATLACMDFNRTDLRPRPWQSFHFSNWKADQSLQALRSDLKSYQLKEGDWPVLVTGPGGVEYQCWNYGTD
jgi:hypothetical protein